MNNISNSLKKIRINIQQATLGNEIDVISKMVTNLQIDELTQENIVNHSATLVSHIRTQNNPGLMESFLNEYGLSTGEGIAIMCLTEAYLRVPDSETLDELISDKIGFKNFYEHLGKSNSSMVNASTWGLMLTGSLLSASERHNLVTTFQGLIRRVGEPVIRLAVKKVMKLMGNQFVLGETIDSAIKTGSSYQKKGYRYSYDMLGESALTQADADRYYISYTNAIITLSKYCKSKDVRFNPGISVKLSALYPRYETLKKENVIHNLLPAILSLCLMSKKAGIGLNIDAEEAERLDLSLDIIEAIVEDGSLKGWDGMGVVVQAYGYRAPLVIDWLYEIAQKYDTKIMVRLVKGAYWDREIKRSQELGLVGYPVFTRKNNTDLSYWLCAQKLLNQRDRIFPQFATHNAHTISSILAMTEDETDRSSTFEFQRLHGMGESLYDLIHEKQGITCRIYAPVGVHKDLLAYLVRRLLENGANASFVSQLLNKSIPPRKITENPIKIAKDWLKKPVLGVQPSSDLFEPERINSKGWDCLDVTNIKDILNIRTPFFQKTWHASPIISTDNKRNNTEQKTCLAISNPATHKKIGTVVEATLDQLEIAINSAKIEQLKWQALGSNKRKIILNKAANLYEQNAGEFFTLLCLEAGKTILDSVSELRESVDFLRYYGAQAEHYPEDKKALGVIACISPWNFPLAIFTGQLSAALASGNAVLVKPAETTPLIAYLAITLLHKAGVPLSVCQFLPGKGIVIGNAMSSHFAIDGIIFTGSTQTAKRIESNMVQAEKINAPLVAETGGLNAMIIDSSALLEQAVNDIIVSSFQSAGQRCSALRIVYLQSDIADAMLEMLYGAMDELKIADPWQLDTDIGPVIDENAKHTINNYINKNKQFILKQLKAPTDGIFVAPTILKVNGIADLPFEVFGPVLHVAVYKACDLIDVIKSINHSGFGLTFGLHTRIESRVNTVVNHLHVGNMYVNRNQIGAIVGSQPFGGEGLSGTGPKAGGPFYLQRLFKSQITKTHKVSEFIQAKEITEEQCNKIVNELLTKKNNELGHLNAMTENLVKKYTKTLSVCRQSIKSKQKLPGPTGEDNILSLHPKGLVVIATYEPTIAFKQIIQALFSGNHIMVFNHSFNQEKLQWLATYESIFVTDKSVSVDTIKKMKDLATFVLTPTNDTELRKTIAYKKVLAQRDGSIIRLITEETAPYLYVCERHLCINTTAAGGNVDLISSAN